MGNNFAWNLSVPVIFTIILKFKNGFRIIMSIFKESEMLSLTELCSLKIWSQYMSINFKGAN